MILGLLSNGRNPVPFNALTRIYWINDGGTMNKGWQKTQGIDWSASYDFDTGDFGAWNVGMVGTYYLNQIRAFPVDPIFPGNSATPFGGESVDGFHQTIAAVGNVQQYGVETLPRMRYR